VLGDDFELVEHNKNAQMQLMIFARKSIVPFIANSHTSCENTGFMHLLPNKGGLCVDLTIDGTRLVFVSTHLAAHEGVKKCKARNESIQEILGGIRSKLDDDRFDPSLQAHHMFWVGDMNYRVTFKKETPADHSAAERAVLNERMKQAKEGNVRQDDSLEEEGEDGEEVNAADISLKIDGENSTPAADKEAASAERKAEMDRVFKMIEEEKWSELLALDELNREVAANRALHGNSLPNSISRSGLGNVMM
jgi:hypothetical protein